MTTPALTSLFTDGDLADAATLNEKIVVPINYLLALSGVDGFDLTPLGRDNGRGRLVLPFQGMTGEPIAITYARTGNGEGAIILYNDNGALAINTETGTLHPLTLEELTFPAGTPAGSIIYSTGNASPAFPDRLRLASLPPATGVLASQGGVPVWNANFRPSGVEFQYGWTSATDQTDDLITDIWTNTATGDFVVGQDVAVTPVFPHGGVVGISVETTYIGDPQRPGAPSYRIDAYRGGIAIQGAVWQYSSSTLTGTVANALTVNRGDQIVLRVEGGRFSSVAVTIRARLDPTPENL